LAQCRRAQLLERPVEGPSSALAERTSTLAATGKVLGPQNPLREETVDEPIHMRPRRLHQIAGKTLAAGSNVVKDAEHRIKSMPRRGPQRLGVGERIADGQTHVDRITRRTPVASGEV
jgi:hypothetical protein